MSHSSQSPLLLGLSEAGKLAMIEEAKEKSPSTSGGLRPVRGASPSSPVPGTAADALVGQLDGFNISIAGQIAVVEKWLGYHPDILRMLDGAMLKHYRRSEQRAALANIAINAIFCVAGAVVGLFLPTLVFVVGHLFAR